MSFDVEGYVRYRIANTPILSYPFPHQFVTSVFPEDYYAQLVAALPPTEAYRPLAQSGTVSQSDAYAERFACDLVDAEEREAERSEGHVLADLAGWLMGKSFRDFLLRLYQRHIVKRFGTDAGMRTDIDGRLIRDFSHYAIGPHTDKAQKLVSLLFYLPHDSSMQHLGTSIYAHLDPSFRCPGGPHYEFTNFRRVATMPYVPNSLFLFFKTDRAFHGVEPIQDENVERNLLLYNIYVDKVVTTARDTPGWLPWKKKSVSTDQ